jgi:RNA polymerase sigma factor (sigma-70 family)
MSSNANLIVEQLRSNDSKAALAKLYQSFPMIRQLIRNNGGNDADAQDVFQEALLVLYKNVQAPEFSLTCAPSTYLYSVSRYLWKDIQKKRNREVVLDQDVRHDACIEQDMEQHQQQQQKSAQLSAVFQQLGEKCQTILKAYYYQKLSMKEIAAALNYGSVNSAKTQKYKCIERAKKIATRQLSSTSKL